MQTQGKGHMMLIGIVAYMTLKFLLNLLLGGGLSWIGLAVLLLVSVLLLMHVKYANWICAAWLTVVMLRYLPANISGLSDGTLIYLLEGILDLGCAALLVCQSEIKAIFSEAK